MDSRREALQPRQLRNPHPRRLRTGLDRRCIPLAAGPAVPAVRRADAVYGQSRKRPLGLYERSRQTRPAGSRPRLRQGIHHPPGHEGRHRRIHPRGLRRRNRNPRLGSPRRHPPLRRLGTRCRGRRLRRLRLFLHRRTLATGLSRHGRHRGHSLFRTHPRGIHLLYPDRNVDMGSLGRGAGLRAGDRHDADGQ